MYIGWFENGQKSAEGNYKNGELDGKYTAWLENGQIEFERIYKDGLCVGGDCDYTG